MKHFFMNDGEGWQFVPRPRDCSPLQQDKATILKPFL
jgi:hypothetical protein